ncbi:hypothetical protein AGMMS50284_4480 [Clostridia bacterium]|nr:hypothetical protein AGMMS50284_4480 [Clostridia bacterium]
MGSLLSVDFDTFDVVPGLIDFVAKKYGERIAVSYYVSKTEISSKTYKALFDDVRRLAYWLKQRKLDFKRICLIGECCYEWIVSFYAISWIGAIPVLIDCELPMPDTLELANISEAEFIIMGNSENKADALKTLSTRELDVLKFDDGKDSISVRSILNQRPSLDLQYVSSNPDDTALIVFTSGTTGKNKAVMLSHKNLCSDLFISYYLAGQGKHHSTVAVLPVHHMLQLTTGIQTPIYVGCPICIGRGKRYISQSIATFKPSILILVPSVIEMMRKKIWADVRVKGIENKLLKAMRFSDVLLKFGIDIRRKIFSSIHTAFGGNLKTVISGGAPISDDTVSEFRTWGINIFNGYGITECSPVVSCNMPRRFRDGSVGLTNMSPYSSVKIIDGEICVSGDIVMKGYYGDEAATNEAFVNGYFKTGDLGHIDSDGYLYITGRKKNLIILNNGENVSPEELEIIFSKIVGIKDVIICSKEIGREMILNAIVVPTDDFAGKINLQEYFDEQFALVSSSLPVHKRVYKVNIRTNDFITSSGGKVKRVEENLALC